MRTILFSIFLILTTISYCQTGKDSLLNVPSTKPISTYSHSENDSIKSKNKWSARKAGFIKRFFGSPDLAKVKKDTASIVSKDSTKHDTKRADGKLNTIVSGQNPASKDQPIKNTKTDSATIKKAIPDVNTKEKVLVTKEKTLIKKEVADTAKIKQQLKQDANIIKGLTDTTKYKNQLKKFQIKQTGSTIESGLIAKKDTLLSQGKSGIRSLKPKAITFLKKQKKAIAPKGNISMGYEYGVLPFVAGNKYPSGGYKTEGRVSFLILDVPLELTYYYTDIKNTIGMNNYFRISYDANRYKDQLVDKLTAKEKSKMEELSKMQVQEQQILQKIQFLNFLKQNPNYHIPVDNSLIKKNVPTLNSGINKDSLAALVDTTGLRPSMGQNPVSEKGATTLILHQSDSLKNNYGYSKKQDSISSELNFCKSKYESINKEINTVKREIEQIKDIQNSANATTNPYLSKVQNILSGIKKFEIGLCHPSYSTFLVNNIPLQGINMEYSKNNKFLAFTYGTTINNLMYNTNTIQGQIQGIRNTYNYFDFGNLSAGRKILSLKGGVGAKEDSHFYVGFLLGKGRTDYLLPVNDPNSTSKESNAVVELDVKYKFSDQLSADVTLGKSSVKEEDLTMDAVKKAVNEIFSGFRSYAFLTRINLGIKKTKTKLTFTTRWVDPYFKSFEIGFLRSDNLRYEIKAEQVITKRINYSIAYRKEEDNLLKLYNYQNTLQSFNNSLNIKLSRRLNIRINYVPLFRELKSNTTIIKDKNQILTTILSYTPRAKKINSTFNFLYCKYIVSADSNKINFENFTYTHQLLFKSGFKTGLNVSWLKNSLKDTLNNDTYLGVLDVGYTAKSGGSFSIGGKMAYKIGMEMQYGFILLSTFEGCV